MNTNELNKLISDSVSETYNDNIEYLVENLENELKSIIDENGKIELTTGIFLLKL